MLWTTGAALADPPRARSHSYEYEAGGCEYERKWERGEYKEEYKCERGPGLRRPRSGAGTPLHMVECANPEGGRYRVTPLCTYAGPQGRQCRGYHTYAAIQGHTQEIYGTACRQPDGSWRRVG